MTSPRTGAVHAWCSRPAGRASNTVATTTSPTPLTATAQIPTSGTAASGTSSRTRIANRRIAAQSMVRFRAAIVPDCCRFPNGRGSAPTTTGIFKSNFASAGANAPRQAPLLGKEICVAILDRYARFSMISVLITVLLITTNHTYTLGLSALGLGAVLLLLPAAFLWWFKNTASCIALAGYMLANLWIVIGFGLMNGLWEVTLNLFLGSLLASVSTSFPKPTIGDFWS